VMRPRPSAHRDWVNHGCRSKIARYDATVSSDATARA
jgi:hypothetical protein